MQAVTTIGLGIAKSVFQVHGVDAAGQIPMLARHGAMGARRTRVCSSDAREPSGHLPLLTMQCWGLGMRPVRLSQRRFRVNRRRHSCALPAKRMIRCVVNR